jgi:hypothetical protein
VDLFAGTGTIVWAALCIPFAVRVRSWEKDPECVALSWKHLVRNMHQHKRVIAKTELPGDKEGRTRSAITGKRVTYLDHSHLVMEGALVRTLPAHILLKDIQDRSTFAGTEDTEPRGNRTQAQSHANVDGYDIKESTLPDSGLGLFTTKAREEGDKVPMWGKHRLLSDEEDVTKEECNRVLCLEIFLGAVESGEETIEESLCVVGSIDCPATYANSVASKVPSTPPPPTHPTPPHTHTYKYSGRELHADIKQ